MHAYGVCPLCAGAAAPLGCAARCCILRRIDHL